jgi:hypothetical protein
MGVLFGMLAGFLWTLFGMPPLIVLVVAISGAAVVEGVFRWVKPE